MSNKDHVVSQHTEKTRDEPGIGTIAIGTLILGPLVIALDRGPEHTTTLITDTGEKVEGKGSSVESSIQEAYRSLDRKLNDK